MDDITVALALKSDSNQLADFFNHYRVTDIIKNRIECYLNHNFTIIVKDRDKIVGILQWYVKENPLAGVAEFEEIYVLEDYRNKKIGSMLVEHGIKSVVNYFKEIKIKPRKIFLFVSKENKNARALYEKYGFKPISEIGNLFSDQEVELFYCLDFD